MTLQYADRKPVDVLIPVTERSVEQRVPLEGVLRGVEISKDDGTMAEIVKDSAPQHPYRTVPSTIP